MNPLFTMLTDLDNGIPLQEINTKLSDLLLASEQLGGKGSLTITFRTDTKLSRKASGTAITCDCKVRKPEVTTNPTSFYLKDGKLHRDDPDQLELELERKTIPIKPRRGEDRNAAVGE